MSGTCVVEGCEQPRRKRGWCASHYAQWYRTGEPPKPFQWKWGRRSACAICAEPVTGSGATCSRACAVLYVTHKSDRPSSRNCERCGAAFSTLIRGKGRHLKRSDTRMCGDCFRAKSTRHRMSVSALVQRDGTNCGICGQPVDMALRHPEQWRASVDHIIPFARGGTHDPENLQLAHLRCNHLKSDRMPV